MILYHGTPLESGEKIIKEGKYNAKYKEAMKAIKILLTVQQMVMCI